jgi:hypothetical protein
MSFKLGLEGNRRSLLAYSILAISVVAAMSSVGIAFAATSATTTSTSTGTQTGSGSQSSTSSSTHNCPNMGGPAGSSASVTGMAG